MADAAHLAIETSQRAGGVALRPPGAGEIDVERLARRSRHDDDLLPAVERLLGRHGLGPRDLGLLAVSIGPGGFTGLRIAVSAAKMIAETTGVTLVGVPSALVVAEGSGTTGGAGDGPIISVLAVKRETFWSTRLRRHDGRWSIEGRGVLVHENDFDPRDATAVLADEHLPGRARARCVERGVPVVTPVFDPRSCLVAAEGLLAAGVTVSALEIQPLYPRPPEAVSIFERRRRGSDTR